MSSEVTRDSRRPPVVVMRSGESVPRVGDLERLANWMDSVFEIPGLGIRFGIDAIVGLLPGIGDAASALVSLYILGAASRYGVPRVTLMRMAMNIGVDILAGSVPLLGDFFDVAWRANVKNVELLKSHVASTTKESRRARRSDYLFVIGASVALLALLVVALVITFWILAGLGRFILGTAH